jgi:hypothetical protein
LLELRRMFEAAIVDHIGTTAGMVS